MVRYLKKNFSTILLVIILIVGLCLLLYPSFSNYWNSFHQSKLLNSYEAEIEKLDDETLKQEWEKAVSFNRKLLEAKTRKWKLSEEESEAYEQIMDVSGTGIMGYIDIPSIKVSLPIYHGVGDDVLQVAVGHLPGSSFPVGGPGTHVALSGHRGLPSAVLFTNLDKVTIGDLFMLNVLNQTLTYEVDSISIVEPDDSSGLDLVPDQDYCTLITCTPYGVNTHRILVRGRRVENLKEAVRITADGVQLNPKMVALTVAVPVMAIIMSVMMLVPRKKEK